MRRFCPLSRFRSIWVVYFFCVFLFFSVFFQRYISLGHRIWCQHGALSGVGAFVASFVPAECPKGGGTWGFFGKPFKRAI